MFGPAGRLTHLRAMAATSTRRPVASPLPRWSGGRHEHTLFRVGIAVIALHVIDDNYISPQPGTSAGDHAPKRYATM